MILDFIKWKRLAARGTQSVRAPCTSSLIYNSICEKVYNIHGARVKDKIAHKSIYDLKRIICMWRIFKDRQKIYFVSIYNAFRFCV